MGVPATVANGTNRIAILAQMVVATATFCKRGYADLRLSVSLALAALPGAILGAYIGAHVGGVWFNRALAVIMLGVMVSMALDRRAEARAVSQPTARRARPALAHLLVGILGFYGGFIQVGVGLLLMPALSRTLGLDLVRVNMHKSFIILVYTVAALAIFAWQTEILWVAGLCLAGGGAIGSWLSVHFQISKGEPIVKTILNLTLALVSIKLLFFS